ncbi:MAG: mechanosensitive ion channel [Planctomycetaceae bacterium]|nr:mechanosensitive ion channel [Planctomycetaceae bacterium]
MLNGRDYKVQLATDDRLQFCREVTPHPPIGDGVMHFVEYLEKSLPYVLPALLAAAGCALVFLLVQWMLAARRKEIDPGRNVRRQLVRLLLTAIVLASVVLIMSFIKQTRESATVLAGLLGIVFSAAITISSATFISNAMAGLMLRAVRNFRVGDYVRVGDHFGRVSERGLFHVELQTEDRDLATLPNLYLVSKPVTVVRASGTIVSTTVSLGYDESHVKVEAALQEAAIAAALEEPFVYILELGDYSITYRIAGFLPEVKRLLSARSRLRTCVLDALHAADVEIVSPMFMNQRQLSQTAVAPASKVVSATTVSSEEATPEDIMFDKAERAEQLESHGKLSEDITNLESQLAATDEAKRKELESTLKQLRGQRDAVDQSLADSVPQEEERE